MKQESLTQAGSDPTMPKQTETKKKAKPVVTSPDGLSGPCVARGNLKGDGMHLCGQQAALRELSGNLTTGRALLCDGHVKVFERQGFKVRLVKPDELPGV